MEQTNRTILFERLNANKESLISLIYDYDEKESLNDQEMRLIGQKLEVGSFEEMIEKFHPEIYMVLDTENKNVHFSREKINSVDVPITPIPICEKDSFVMKVIELINNKKNRRYVVSSFQEYCHTMLPDKDMNAFLKIRKKLFSAVMKNEYKKAEDLLISLQTEFDDGVFLLKAFISEMQKIIEMQEENFTGKRFLIESEEAEVSTISVSDKYLKSAVVSESQSTKFKEYLKEFLSKHSTRNTTLFFSLLQLECGVLIDELSTYIELYDEYLMFYKDLLQKMWWSTKPLYETLLGIKAFFAQYDNTQGIMPPKLLIVNDSLDVVNMMGNRKILELYLESTNEKNYNEDVIWYAIIPGVSFEGIEHKNIRQRFKSATNEFSYKTNEENDIFDIISLLSRYNIQSFVSAVAVADSTFVQFVKVGYEQWENVFSFLNNLEDKELVSPCFPNFTLIPRAFTMTNIGKKYSYNAIRKSLEYIDKVNIWFDDMNIEASYVAAGLFAATQCPSYLQRFFPRRTSLELPGVSYRICSDDHEKVTTTQMFHEVTRYSEELLHTIMRRSTGVVFAPGKRNIQILTDREFSYSGNNPSTISMKQSLTYMERVIRYRSQDFKEHLIKDFFQDRNGMLMSVWKKDTDNVNSLLKKGENINYEIDSERGICRFDVQFLDGRKDNTVKMNK